MRKSFVVFALLILILCFAGCQKVELTPEQKQYIAEHREVGYSTPIMVKVTSVDQHYWYASGAHYIVKIQVYCEEYDKSTTFEFTGSDAVDAWDIRRGDTLRGSLWTRAYANGEVISRYIDHVDLY